MPKRSSKKTVDVQRQPPEPLAESGQSPAEVLASPPAKNPAVALGRLGGKKGGVARVKRLTKEQRSEIARKAAAARWKKD
jgi:hypothetical protein